MNRLTAIAFFAAVFIMWPCNAFAWNIPGHMLSGAIAYQLLQRENPAAIARIRSILEKNPWYETHWTAQLEKLPETDRIEMLFMLAARWADDIRTKDPSLSHPLWHYVGFPFKPEGEPPSIKTTPPLNPNLLTAIVENERIAQSGSEPEKRGIALAWLFHLVGDIHQPLDAIQMFSREYPHGDRGGMEMCVRVSLNGEPLELHRLWDGVITSSENTNQITSMASDLLHRFSTSPFRELDHPEPEAWAKESYEIAVKIAYENGSLRGTPKGQAKDCRAVNAVTFVSRDYPARARLNANRRMYLAGYRLADLLRATVER